VRVDKWLRDNGIASAKGERRTLRCKTLLLLVRWFFFRILLTRNVSLYHADGFIHRSRPELLGWWGVRNVWYELRAPPCRFPAVSRVFFRLCFLLKEALRPEVLTLVVRTLRILVVFHNERISWHAKVPANTSRRVIVEAVDVIFQTVSLDAYQRGQNTKTRCWLSSSTRHHSPVLLTTKSGSWTVYGAADR
jgi:hypothetical protein